MLHRWGTEQAAVKTALSLGAQLDPPGEHPPRHTLLNLPIIGVSGEA